MSPTAIDPLADLPLSPTIAALPKADLHVHAEADARLDRVPARREGRSAYDRRGWVERLLERLAAPGVLL
jgi:hypothetical protein